MVQRTVGLDKRAVFPGVLRGLPLKRRPVPPIRAPSSTPAHVLAALVGVAPDDITRAWADLVERGTGWTSKVTRALERSRPDAATLVDEILVLCSASP